MDVSSIATEPSPLPAAREAHRGTKARPDAEDRRLEEPEPEAAVALGHEDRRPAQRGHLRPQLGRVSGRAGLECADDRAAALGAQEVPRRGLQQAL